MQAEDGSFSWWAVVAALLHAVAGFFYLASGLLAPLWAIVALVALWLALTWQLWKLRSGPRALFIPLAAAAIWFTTMWLGERFLNWTA